MNVYRATLRRGFAFSTSVNNKNPPLLKSRNVTSLSVAHQNMAPSAGTATCPTNHIQVVYESFGNALNKKEANASDT